MPLLMARPIRFAPLALVFMLLAVPGLAATASGPPAARSSAGHPVTLPAPIPLVVRYRDAAGKLIGAALASDHAYLRLSQLCDGIGNRLSGSEALERAVDWAEKAMREDGL
jgi:hypothetical protein